MKEFFAFVGLIMLVTPGFSAEPVGSWRGTWSSNSTGHHGAMRAKITPRYDGQYDARFTGRFAVVIPFVYRVTMTPIFSGPSETTLVANKRLGPILGSYQMTAIVSGNQFTASFNAAGDSGLFQMRRASR